MSFASFKRTYEYRISTENRHRTMSMGPIAVLSSNGFTGSRFNSLGYIDARVVATFPQQAPTAYSLCPSNRNQIHNILDTPTMAQAHVQIGSTDMRMYRSQVLK